MKTIKTTQNSVICVLGMHRSGTSMLTKILNLCGLEIGDDSDVVENDDYSRIGNETGHWENQKFSAINKEILSVFTGGDNWQEDPRLPVNWLKDKRLKKISIKAQELVDDFDRKYKIWGWKDPRTCLTLPFWQNIIKKRLVYVIPIRDPEDSANSLVKRDNIDPIKGKLIWTIYNEKIVTYTQDQKKIHIEIEKIYLDPILQINNLLSELNIESLKLTPSIKKKILRYINPKLWHNRDFKKSVLTLNIPNNELGFYKSYLFHLFSLTKDSLQNYISSDKLFTENVQLKKTNLELNVQLSNSNRALLESQNRYLVEIGKMKQIFSYTNNELIKIKNSHFFKLYPFYEKVKSIVKSFTTKYGKK